MDARKAASARDTSRNDAERPAPDSTAPGEAAPDFIRETIQSDVRNGKNGGRVVTRFPPEPNGYLHIGHAKSICLNFGVAEEFGGRCHLRFDDTNPLKEDPHYVDAIQADVRWLGFDWGEHLYHASDYFGQMYDYAVQLVRAGKAYVDSSTEEEIRRDRGTVTEPGRPSPFRDRPVAENLELLERMRRGEFPDGAHVLRARIDMASPNMKMRDPLIYRIRRVPHHRTGPAWHIYPMYDFAHCLSDSIEGITHSLCTLEFENNRELYDWFLDALRVECHPQQIEFARLTLSHPLMRKRLVLDLVEQGIVSGWDDPRLPTLAGLRRRGVTPAALRAFCDRIGVAKRDNVVDVSLLDYYIREDLNRSSRRVMVVLRPLRVVLDNYPEGRVEEVEAVNNPEDPAAGVRRLPFSRVLYIERDDFRTSAPKKFFRLAPGREVRLKHAYLIRCDRVVEDEHGEPIELHCTYDPESRGGTSADGRRVPGTLHWVAAATSVPAEVRLYDHLFNTPDPAATIQASGLAAALNPASLVVLDGCRAEPGLSGVRSGDHFQFLLQGYFCVDPETTAGKRVFNRTLPLRDSWAKIEKRELAPDAR